MKKQTQSEDAPMLREVRADQPATWCHLAPFGRYTYVVRRDGQPLRDAAGRPVTDVQVLDAEGLRSVAAAFDPASPALVDREHWSLTKGDSTAMGWIEQVEVRGDGLWCLVRWTDIGREQVENRRLRWLSPVWDTGADGRPLPLQSAGLTNDARFKNDLTPVVNKADPVHTQHDPCLDGTKEPEHMKELAQLLGLAEGAAEGDILAAVKALQAYKADAERAAIATEAEAAYAANKDAIANKADFIARFTAAPEFGRAFAAVLKKPEAKADPVTNKAEARKPSFATDRDPVLNKLEQFQAMPEGDAKDRFQREHAAELLDLQRAAK